MYDYSKLRGKIIEVCGTQKEFAKRLRIGSVSLNQRLNNKLEFSQDEIVNSCEILNLEKKDIPIYFFSIKV